ncbi:MAG: right-handed parallel beta-helix repeat-containing protein [Chloroflexi bacterium]|nr:right-handed parallel beta-helix repeat-containing protein [Chloroflexota bacterium]
MQRNLRWMMVVVIIAVVQLSACTQSPDGPKNNRASSQTATATSTPFAIPTLEATVPPTFTPTPAPTSLLSPASPDDPFAVSTYHSISIYWSPEGGSPDQQVLVRFRPQGRSEWLEGLPMKYRPISDTELDKATYRGSIVHLTPNIVYEIELAIEGTTLNETLIVKTWTEEPPIGETVTFSGTLTEELVITESGTPDAYRLYDGRYATIDVEGLYDHAISIKASHIIIRGFNLLGARKHVIRIFEGEDIIIEGNDMSNWGTPDDDDGQFGKNLQSAVYSDNPDARRIVVQRNKIHHPRTDSNSWAEEHYLDDEGNFTYHPRGPQAITIFNSAGNHVIRYNEIWSDADHYFNDVIGAGSNSSFQGFPGPDSDIYGNYIANCWDDGIEAEGGGQNVRIWNNYVEDCFMAIGNAPVSIGPLYVWRNVSGRSYSPPGSEHGEYGNFLKMGAAASDDWMTGLMYIFHNTIYNPNDQGMGGFGSDGKTIRHAVARNNILHVRPTNINSIAIDGDSEDNDFDFDLFNRNVPNGHEANGLSGTPSFVSGAGFDFASMMGIFQLAAGSLGFDSGEIIPNFNACSYIGAGPDIGAHESGWGPLVYGINALEEAPVGC